MNAESFLIVLFMLLAYFGGIVTGYDQGRKAEYIKAMKAGVGHWVVNDKGFTNFEYKH